MARIPMEQGFEELLNRFPIEWLTKDPILDGEAYKMLSVEYMNGTQSSTFKTRNLDKLNQESIPHWHGIEMQEISGD
jgi:hypothetical protein